MKILYNNLYEREGNDSWLKDRIKIYIEDGELTLHHKIMHDGWGGEIRENITIDLDVDDIESSQKRVNDYLYDHSLEDEMKIDLKELLC
jgi:hypothetical protein